MASRKSNTVLKQVSLLTEHDVHLFREGIHHRLYEKLGARAGVENGRGTHFAVWAPNARSVSVIGDFNRWSAEAHPLEDLAGAGIWEGFVADAEPGCHYKYHIVSRANGCTVDKADPFGFGTEEPPQTASRVSALDYDWHDSRWMDARSFHNAPDQPISIYEVHLGSWRRVPDENNRFLTYREIAPLLAEHMQKMGFTHAEFMPLMEHPFYGSWGYQTTGYFAPTARYGSPQDFMFLVDYLHQRGFGVILDWVPSHFPRDEHGLGFFDGTHLFEHPDPRRGENAEWGGYVFDYGRGEVRSFLMSSAMFWLDKYHVDGLRVDAVASMLYLDYARKPGEWLPNALGGRENFEAIAFLKQFNSGVYKEYPGVQTIAEESTSWPKVSRPVSSGGLGFGMKWDMGWMHDTLDYLSHDPIERKHHHDKLTFRSMYAFNENYVLSLSHDEVVNGKKSLLGRMPGDDWQKAANLRLLYGYQYSQPGKKLLFMGDEFAQSTEWHHDRSLDWHELSKDVHHGVQRCVEDLNSFYRRTPALYEFDFDPRGFEWIYADDKESSALSYLRHGASSTLLVACNFTPLRRENYRVGVPKGGYWREVFNTDAREYGGSGAGNMGGLEADPIPANGRRQSLNLILPPLSVIFFHAP